MDAQHPSPSFRDRLSPAITPAQVIALGLVAASIGWAVWLLRDRPTSEEVELLAGMPLPSSEMAIMEAAFDRAQLTDHRTDGGRVFVPRSRQSAYMRALVDAEALPREFGGSLRRALEKNSPWQSRAVQDELLRVATQEELALVICSMPGIERAAVLYDVENHHSLEGGGPAKTASVNVRTQPDMELDPARVQAIRVLVSASIAGLAPERVAVTDLRSGRVYSGPLEAPPDTEAQALAVADPALARRIAHEQHLAAKVRQSLAFVKGATVDVSVEFGAAESATAPVPPGPEEWQADRSATPDADHPGPAQKLADANAPAEIRPRSAIIVAAPPPPPPAPAPPAVPQPAARATQPDAPESILVSIAVPDSYFQIACRAAAERAGQPALQPIAIEAHEIERIRRHVLSLLPATRDPAQRRVVITSFPVASPSLARREQAGRAAAGGPAAAERAASPAAVGTVGTPRTPGDIVDMLAAGRLAEVPRQVWLAATSLCVGLLAGFLWWVGGRRDQSRAGGPSSPGMHQPRIDWSGVGDAHDAEPAHAGRGAGIGRAAVLLVALCASGGPALAAGPESTAAVPQVLPALPLAADGTSPSADQAAGSTSAAGRTGQLSDWKLLAAIAAAFGVVAAATAFSKRRAAILPPDVFEVLGEGSLGGQHAVRIVRFGPKTLLVGVSAAGCQTLAELSDPQATSCIAAACRGVHPPLRPKVSPRIGGPQSQPAVAARTGGEAA
jgi:type III secretory pathway lipoprotein EscJ/flagellar biogenesis protein FliO